MRMRWSIVVMVVVGALVADIAAVAAGSVPQDKVRLIEFKVKPQRDSIAAGKTKFVAKNAGTEEHEFVVVRGDDPEALPTSADGSVDEDQIPTADQIGELEEINPGKKKSKTFKLSAGTYILFCNVVDTESDGTVVSHFAEGMFTTLDVS